MRLFVLSLLALAAVSARAQHDHARPTTGADRTGVAETFVVTGLRIDEADPPPGSAVGRAGLRFEDGGTVSVVYGRPYARGRVVFGGLVGYDLIWAAGAHRATELATTVPLAIGGATVSPGVYALFVTPGTDRWTLHVNTRPGQHLADEYDAAEDLATVDAVPTTLDATVEGLTWAFADDGTALTLAWDRTSVSFPIRCLP